MLYLLCGPVFCHAQEYQQGSVFSVIEENDLVANTDRHYTQGIKLAYLSGDNELPKWWSSLSAAIPTWGFTNRAEKIGFEVGQNIYTPDHLTLANPDPRDEPYAGWLYTGPVLQRRGPNRWGMGVLENIQLDLGVIGPWSLAEDAQSWVHHIRGFLIPQGWSHQLKNEPGVDLKYERSWRYQFPAENVHSADFITRAGFQLGNVETSARVGGAFRFGWHVPNDFGPQIIDSITTTEGGWESAPTAGRWGCYVFAGGQAKAVGYEAFFDGNLFRPGPHVDKETYVGEWYAGFVAVLRRVETGFTFVVHTKEFTTQLGQDAYGSVFIKARL